MEPPNLDALLGSHVSRLSLDYEVILTLVKGQGATPEVSALLTIGGDFMVSSSTGSTNVSPESQLGYEAVVPLLRRTITKATIEPDEALTLSFEDAMTLHVPRSPEYEAWEISGRGVAGWISGPA